jgi:hypothetical protein
MQGSLRSLDQRRNSETKLTQHLTQTPSCEALRADKSLFGLPTPAGATAWAATQRSERTVVVRRCRKGIPRLGGKAKLPAGAPTPSHAHRIKVWAGIHQGPRSAGMLHHCYFSKIYWHVAHRHEAGPFLSSGDFDYGADRLRPRQMAVPKWSASALPSGFFLFPLEFIKAV